MVPGLSTREVDRLAGISEGHTWTLERDSSRNHETKTIDKIARVFGFSLDYLVRGEGDPPTEDRIREAVELARREYAAAHESAEPPVPSTGTDDGEPSR